MLLESVKIEIAGETGLCSNWASETVNPGVTFRFSAQCEIKRGLSLGEHSIRTLVYGNNEWWASDWQVIPYQPSTADKECSQTG